MGWRPSASPNSSSTAISTSGVGPPSPAGSVGVSPMHGDVGVWMDPTGDVTRSRPLPVDSGMQRGCPPARFCRFCTERPSGVRGQGTSSALGVAAERRVLTGTSATACRSCGICSLGAPPTANAPANSGCAGVALFAPA
eukprot:scaffold109558_cov28-Tisochrysis_lutea.AAC.1